MASEIAGHGLPRATVEDQLRALCVRSNLTIPPQITRATSSQDSATVEDLRARQTRAPLCDSGPLNANVVHDYRSLTAPVTKDLAHTATRSPAVQLPRTKVPTT